MTMLRVLFPVALLMIGCASSNEATSATDEAIVDGADTFEHPEIGLLHNGGS